MPLFLDAFKRSITQIGDPAFRFLVTAAILSALLLLGGLSFLLDHYWDQNLGTGFAFLDTLGFSVTLLLIWYFFFPLIINIVTGLFAETIITRVEKQFYPERPARYSPSLFADIKISLYFTFLSIFLNSLALTFYIILLFATAGLGSFLLFFLVNSYIFGKEFFYIIASRHTPVKAIAHHPLLKLTWRGGAVITLIFSVPILNILAPLLSIIFMVHLFHLSMDQLPPQEARR